MKLVHSIAEIQSYVNNRKSCNDKVAFVPTMGNLHNGHLALIKTAKEAADRVIVSIYVNPLQFGANEDYDSYPRTFDQDYQLLKEQDIDLVYAAKTQEIYPEGSENHTHVTINTLDRIHCGKSRPTFFRGVATVVTKLFNIVRPDIAVFGEKDFQQLIIIRKLVTDMCMPITIMSIPTAREDSGLAQSSRNSYLTQNEREDIAPLIFKILNNAKALINKGERDYDIIRRNAFARMTNAGIKPDYCNVCNPITLLPAQEEDKDLVILVAGSLGNVRLIDNISFSIND